MFTLTEAWAWGRETGELVDRPASPWDSPSHRPSHADKRRAWRWALLSEEIREALRPRITEGISKPSLPGCSAWQHDIYRLTESTDSNHSHLKHAHGYCLEYDIVNSQSSSGTKA